MNTKPAALVTGASTGIGAVYADRLVRARVPTMRWLVIVAALVIGPLQNLSLSIWRAKARCAQTKPGTS